MITATMFAIWLVIVTLVALIGLFAGGWWFIIGVLVGALALGSVAATSERVRTWFVDLDNLVDDERLKRLANERWNGEIKVDEKTTIKVVPVS